MTTSFSDHFSSVAHGYARYRPGYPPPLFAWLASLPGTAGRAWDCATGSGQAALGLSPHFRQVIATDASATQVANAEPRPNIEYRTAPAEASGLESGSIDLITVAQALHWFDLEGFYGEARRVLRPGGVVAVWSYNFLTVAPPVDAVVHHLYGEILGNDWPAERFHVERGYADLPFPFEPQEAPPFGMEAQWALTDLVGYLNTWSAVQRYRGRTGTDPVAAIAGELRRAWGDAEQVRTVRWPLVLRVGR